MYPKKFFIEQFSEMDSEHLLVKLSSEDLADNASDAIRDILTARGMSVTEIDSISKKVHKAQYRLARRTIECDFCGNSARHHPVLNEGQRFCSKNCLHRARISEAAVDLTEAMILQGAGKIRSGACPMCSSMASPVEMRYSYTAISYIIKSTYNTRTRLCCVQCGRKENRQGMLVSFFAGWWSIPSRPIYTIAALIGNLKAMFEMRGDGLPSDELISQAKYQLALSALENQAQMH